jgi:hypothetical protein
MAFAGGPTFVGFRRAIKTVCMCAVMLFGLIIPARALVLAASSSGELKRLRISLPSV